MMHKLAAVFLAVAIISGIVAISAPNVFAEDVECQDCTLKFKGKNEINIKIPTGTGTQGPPGPEGPQGPKGDTGDQGPAGEDGKDAELSEEQTDTLQFVQDNRDVINEIIQAYQNGSLGATLDVINEEPPVDNGTDTNSTE